ncbi:MAG: AraC family transcriptional regulator [Clostridia bacterium]|nr:AraC family transcriptional regulator [Clostridia bacterium]
MTFYEIKLLSVPKFLFAAEVKLENYYNKFPWVMKNYLETSVICDGRFLVKPKEGVDYIVGGGTFFSVPDGFECENFAVNKEIHHHATVGVLAEYELKKYDDIPTNYDLRRKIREESVILIPAVFPLKDKYETALDKIRKVISLYRCGAPYTKILSEWLSFTSFITDVTLSALDDPINSPHEIEYTNKASDYINLHVKERISVSDVAKELKVSEGRLYSAFKKVKGVSPIAYLNLRKVDYVKDLIKSRSVSLENAAVEVGIDDPAYFSRLFKKVTGVTFKDYRDREGKR